MIRQARTVEGYRAMPILFEEDDHFYFDKPENNMVAALPEGISWGYIDPGASDDVNGYQFPPVDWGIDTERKLSFLHLLREQTGGLMRDGFTLFDTHSRFLWKWRPGMRCGVFTAIHAPDGCEAIPGIEDNSDPLR